MGPLFYMHLWAGLSIAVLACIHKSSPLWVMSIGFILFLLPDLFVKTYSYFFWFAAIDGVLALIATLHKVHRFALTGYLLSFVVNLAIALQPHSGWLYQNYEMLMGACLGFYLMGLWVMLLSDKQPHFSRY